jgi:hypothetical protein
MSWAVNALNVELMGPRQLKAVTCTSRNFRVCLGAFFLTFTFKFFLFIGLKFRNLHMHYMGYKIMIAGVSKRDLQI